MVIIKVALIEGPFPNVPRLARRAVQHVFKLVRVVEDVVMAILEELELIRGGEGPGLDLHAIRGLIRAHQGSSAAERAPGSTCMPCTQMHSDAFRCTQMHSELVQSDVIRRHQTKSDAIRCTQTWKFSTSLCWIPSEAAAIE